MQAAPMCGHSLPNFQRLVELLGESSALLLCWKRGGRTVYISGRDAGALGRWARLSARKAWRS